MSVPAAEAPSPDRVATVGPGGELRLPPEVLRNLRLLRPESFVVFSEGRHFVHMIRADAGPATLARAERISLHGSIEGFGIADLFSLLNMSRRNGALLLISDQVQKSIYFRRGEIVFAGSNVPEDRLGQVLYRTGKLSREALTEAEGHLVPGKRFGEILLERRLIDTSTLLWGAQHQIEEIVYSVFRFSHGSFFFFDGDFVDSELARFTIDTNNVLMEGYQRVDELGLIRQHIRGRGAVLRPTGRKVKAKLPERLARVLGLVDGRNTVEDIVRATGWGEFNTFKVLYKLLQGGLAEAAEEPAAPAPGSDPAGAERLALVETYNRIFMLVRDVLRAKAVEVDQGRVFEAFLRSASDATRAVFHGVVLGPSGRVSADQLADNIDHLLLLEAAGLRPADERPADRRQDLLGNALAEWTLFQSLVIRNLLPESEAGELVSYVRAIQKSGLMSG